METVAYSELLQASGVYGFAEMVNGFEPLSISVKISILDVLGSLSTPLGGVTRTSLHY